jgi:hypothetical protein
LSRIYLLHQTSATASWWWGINTITFDSTVGDPMKGYAETLPTAQAEFRAAFDRWLAWALALPKWDPNSCGFRRTWRRSAHGSHERGRRAIRYLGFSTLEHHQPLGGRMGAIAYLRIVLQRIGPCWRRGRKLAAGETQADVCTTWNATTVGSLQPSHFAHVAVA